MSLPTEIYISLMDTSPERYMSFTGPERLLRFSPDEGVFSVTVKFYIDRAENGLVHIRSAYNNLYWVRETESDELLSVSAPKPVEDSKKVGCTLFRPNVYSGNRVSFQHVGSQLNVTVQKTEPYYITVANAAPSEFSYLNYDDLRKIPRHVALIGDNGMRLTARTINNRPYLQFLELDTPAEQEATVFETSVTRTGDIRFKSLTFEKMWRLDGTNWIMVDYADEAYNDPNNPSTVFKLVYGVYMHREGISLRCRQSNNFCRRLDDGGLKSCLAIGASSQMEEKAVFEPIGLSNANVHVTSFRQEYTKQGLDIVLLEGQEIKNDTKQDKEVVLNKTYSHLQSLEFSNATNMYIKQQGWTTFYCQLPSFNEQQEIQIPDEVKEIFELSWGISGVGYGLNLKEANVKVTVPAMTKLTVRLIGKRLSAKIPFSYTQSDQFATVNLSDGVFSGVYVYLVVAEVIESQPL